LSLQFPYLRNHRSQEESTMGNLRTLLDRKPSTALLALAVVLAGGQYPARAQGFKPVTASTAQQTPAGRTVWHHVGRLYFDPGTGKFVWAGYLVFIDPIGGSLFDGSPAESSAYFTFSTDVGQLTPLPSNNDAVLGLVSAGTFNVYYNATPAGDWSNPSSFSSGKLVARFHRNQSVAQLSPIAFHDLSETLMWSTNFEFGGRTYNFNRIAPNGITFAQFLSTAPQAGTPDFPLTFAGSGSVFAVGAP
jgi:hypothetical protein